MVASISGLCLAGEATSGLRVIEAEAAVKQSELRLVILIGSLTRVSNATMLNMLLIPDKSRF